MAANIPALNMAMVEKIIGMWKLAAPPIRPGESALSVYRSHLPVGSNWKGLIQGATPELVDMMVQKGPDRIVAMEQYREVIEAMRRLSSLDWSGVETICGDWCDYRIDFENSFDVIFCDGGSLFLPFPEGWERLYRVTFRYLCSGGKTVSRLYSVPDDAPDFLQYYEQALRRFDREAKGHSLEEQLKSFIDLASEVKGAVYFRAVDSQGTILPDRMKECVDYVRQDLYHRYQDQDIRRVVDAIFGRINSTPHEDAQMVAAPPYRLVQPLLESIGFKVRMEPIYGPPKGITLYMLIAEKPEPGQEKMGLIV